MRAGTAEDRLSDDPAAWLRMLQTARHTINGCRTVGEVLNSVLATARRIRCSGANLLLLDEREQYLYVAAAQGLPGQFAVPARPIRLDEPVSICQTVLSGRPMWLDSFAEHRDRYPARNALSGADLVSGKIPLTVGGVRLGVLVVLRDVDEPFTTAQKAFLESMADIAAVAIQRLTGRYGTKEADEPPSLPQLSAGAGGQAMHAAEVGEFCWDIAADTVTADGVVAAMHGADPAGGAFPTSQLLSGVLPEDLAEASALMANIRRHGGGYQLRYRARDGVGRVRVLEMRGSAAHTDAAGKPRLMRGTITDITAEQERRRRTEQALAELTRQRQQLQALATALNTTAALAELNTAAQEALGMFGASGFVLAEHGPQDDIVVAASSGIPATALQAVRDLPLSTPAPLSDALTRRTPVFVNNMDALLAEYPHFSGRLNQAASSAWAALPLPVRSTPQAACLITFPDSYSFTAPRRALLMVVAHLIADALDRIRIHQAEHDLATTLQASMLPSHLYQPAGTAVAGIYRPATTGLQVGGDWYDALPTPRGHLALIVGDVQGHGVNAAAFMGQLRTAVRAYVHLGHTPSTVLARTNTLLTEMSSDLPEEQLFATCIYAQLDPRTGHLTLTRAGHHPPLTQTPGGTAHVLDCPGGLPLGLFGDQKYPTFRTRLQPGARLFQYTDGLIEHPEDRDSGVRQLAEALTDAPPSPEDALRHVIAACRPATVADDIAALITVRTERPIAGT